LNRLLVRQHSGSCRDQATHVFQTAEQAIDSVMVEGRPSPNLPFVHKDGLQLIQATYSSQAEATAKITSGLEDFYRTQFPDVWSAQRRTVGRAVQTLVVIYKRNVFPSMKVTWGTYPNNIGHMDYPGCFRCHDGSQVAKNGQTLSNDCSLCHDLLAVDESNPKVLSQIGLNARAASLPLPRDTCGASCISCSIWRRSSGKYSQSVR
jgi:hypothetical protein